MPIVIIGLKCTCIILVMKEINTNSVFGISDLIVDLTLISKLCSMGCGLIVLAVFHKLLMNKSELLRLILKFELFQEVLGV